MWWIAAAVVVLLVIASGPGLFRSFAPAEIDSAEAARRAALAVAIGVAIAAVLAAIGVLWWSRTHTSQRLPPRAFGGASIIAGVALMVTLFAATGASTATSPPGADGPSNFESPSMAPSTLVFATAPPAGEVNHGPGPDLSWLGTLLQMVIVVAVVAVVVKAIVVLRRHWSTLLTPAPHADTFVQPVQLDEPDIDNEAAADSFANSARALLASGDPRAAIIAAYAALLEGLEAAGTGRRPHEAPEEHLQRSLTQLRVPADALAGVTRLFLVAKFSDHPLGESDRDQARQMLADAEQHLRSLESSR